MIADVSFNERRLVAEAWREWRINSAYVGQSPDALPVRYPSGFRRVELGFGWGEGPSLMWTCRSLEDDNRRAVTQLGSEAPCSVTYPRPSAPKRRAPRRPREATHEELVARLLELLDLQPNDLHDDPTQDSTRDGSSRG